MGNDNYLKVEFEQRLRSDAALFDFLQAGSLDGIWYWDIERPEHEWMSPRFWELLGYDPATKKHLASEWQEMIDPDDLQLALDNFRKHCADPAHPYDQIVRYKHKDGSTVWVRCRGIAIRDQNGKPIRMLGAHNDLTQVMRLQEELAQAVKSIRGREHESRTVIENSPDTIARYDCECRRIYVNPAFGAMAEGGVAALLGKKPSEAPGGPNSEIYEARIREVIASGKDSHFELKWSGKDGKEICSHIRLTAEHDSSGAVISVLGIGRDISELNESRDELNRKELSKSRFLAAAGHDLRQPLAAANLFIDALKFTAPSPEQNQIIRGLEQAMATFRGLLDALLDISKLDAGIINPEYTSIDVSRLIEWLEWNFTSLAAEKKIELRHYVPTKTKLTIRSDMALVKSVLMNLVSNAIKFTSTGGILVSARRRGNEVLFQVWDTGAGIKTEHLGKIFDEFYQIDNPQRDRTSGLGLGLSIARRSISLLGGEISCRSQFGRGSVFGFRLPLDNSRDEEIKQAGIEAHQEEVSAEAFVRGKRFIVVEDDALVAEALSRSLTAMGVEVECFHSAEEALLGANVQDADYYIVDYMLSGNQNGIQLLNQIRQKLGRSIKAVMMTGDTSADFIRKAGLFDWPVVHKPANISKLISRLREQDIEGLG